MLFPCLVLSNHRELIVWEYILGVYGSGGPRLRVAGFILFPPKRMARPAALRCRPFGFITFSVGTAHHNQFRPAGQLSREHRPRPDQRKNRWTNTECAHERNRDRDAADNDVGMLGIDVTLRRFGRVAASGDGVGHGGGTLRGSSSPMSISRLYWPSPPAASMPSILTNSIATLCGRISGALQSLSIAQHPSRLKVDLSEPLRP